MGQPTLPSLAAAPARPCPTPGPSLSPAAWLPTQLVEAVAHELNLALALLAAQPPHHDTLAGGDLGEDARVGHLQSIVLGV
jgi:hypothetical protein